MSYNTTRGLRNLNPGNIRRSAVCYKGERRDTTDSAFKQFESLEMGYRAIFVLLHTYKLRGYGQTIAQMISRYAPASENDTEAYICRVTRATGIDKDALLDTHSAEQMIPIVCAISAVENGVTADLEAVQRGWELFRADY